MDEQIKRIKIKLGQFKNIDRDFTLFGAQKHRYKLNPTIPLNTITQFEIRHKINLPIEYVHFLTDIGNGSAGPFYGLGPLENALFDDLDYKRPDSLLNPAKPFVHTEPWNLIFKWTVDEEENEDEYEKEYAAFEEKYFDGEYMNGVIAICNYGCAISLNLVVNGQEYGNVWTDDRASNNGTYPSHELGNTEKINFLNWYELWLDNSLQEISSKNSTSETTVIDIKQFDETYQKPWWKFW